MGLGSMAQLCASRQEDPKPSLALAVCTASAGWGIKEKNAGLAFSASGIRLSPGWRRMPHESLGHFGRGRG